VKGLESAAVSRVPCRCAPGPRAPAAPRPPPGPHPRVHSQPRPFGPETTPPHRQPESGTRHPGERTCPTPSAHNLFPHIFRADILEHFLYANPRDRTKQGLCFNEGGWRNSNHPQRLGGRSPRGCPHIPWAPEWRGPRRPPPPSGPPPPSSRPAPSLWLGPKAAPRHRKSESGTRAPGRQDVPHPTLSIL